MEKLSHICTSCGYEGTPVKAVNDDTDGATQSDGSKALARVANLVLPGSGMLIRPLAMLISLPLYLLLWPIKRKLKGGPKNCPNCGLPFMVRLNSDAGWLAKRKLDIKAGLVVIDADGNAHEGTGNVALPPIISAAPDPGMLPTLDRLLNEAPLHAVEMKEVAVEKPIEKPVTKKPVDPDQF